ncbi:hypothetical protein [Saccharomonospora iraqiensis]|uniref:hypothetical protein n=1 Tax=Saccharomonospora iraqiensis TaxID=52698 RepID=UPI00022E82CA|nr:hypothetical protein [Saccharomonospora iraqiensis]
MPRIVAEYEFVFVPFYRLITLSGPEGDWRDAREALRRANRSVVATDTHELFISCAQDLLPVRAVVRVWDSPIEPASVATEQAGVSERLPLNCPTAGLTLGSPTAPTKEVKLPDGPGRYELVVVHRGRADALRQHEAVMDRPLDEMGDLSREEPVEQYTINLWPAT